MDSSSATFASPFAQHGQPLWSISPLHATIIAMLFLVVGLIAIYTMISLQGRTKPSHPEFYRKLHKWSGWVFAVLFIFMVVAMSARMKTFWEEPSARVALHISLAITVIFLLLVKITIPRFFARLRPYLFTIGIGVFTLGFTLVWITAGYYLTSVWRDTPYISQSTTMEQMLDLELGKELFISRCSVCHPLDRIMQHRSIKNWEEVVNKMVQIAEPRITPDEAKQILNYLVQTHGPEPVEGDASASPIAAHCYPCHEPQEILGRNLSADGWLAIVKQMNSYGPEIVPEDKYQEIIDALMASEQQQQSVSP